jgi:leucyl-tRNA synthetase
MRNQGMILGEDGEKMSKSRGNVVNPDHLVEAYGADAVRAYLMFIGPWDQGGPWNYQGIEGVSRFLNRVWSAIAAPAEASEGTADEATLKELRRAVHHAIAKVTDHLEGFRFNTAVAELMTLQNAMTKARAAGAAGAAEWTEAGDVMTLLLAPIAPHLAEELWARAGHEGSVHLQAWPEADATALVRDEVVIAVQVSGKLRGEVTVPADATKEDLLAAAKASPNVQRHLEGMTVVREIVVPGKLVNLVVKPQG